ncbi:MAG: molybdenum cofactor biosynthesis protein MoaE [Ardenticatenaceae bacterium]|nr:molybdenum cofactor biosynthesis protein MoaE [Ardenticatenaceae bacterium]MCB9444600.1 molybdenum cofactor biosynthesis protein MoaE [Ardenticatenaceae bacterium]
MKLQIRLFATLKDRAGRDRIEISLDEPATVQTLLDVLTAVHPNLAPILPSALVAVNKNFAAATTPIWPGDEVALFPPVSGGSSEIPHPTYFAITEEEFDLNAIHARLNQPDVGAIVSFTGFVRGQTQREGMPPQTIHLEYEAYSEMAGDKMAQIAREIWQRWPQVKGIAIVQRIGKLDVGQHTTFVACAAGHRDQGVFDAARYGIDRLKEIVPVWKKEVGPDKSVWVEGHYRPTEEDN